MWESDSLWSNVIGCAIGCVSVASNDWADQKKISCSAIWLKNCYQQHCWQGVPGLHFVFDLHATWFVRPWTNNLFHFVANAHTKFVTVPNKLHWLKQHACCKFHCTGDGLNLCSVIFFVLLQWILSPWLPAFNSFVCKRKGFQQLAICGTKWLENLQGGTGCTMMTTLPFLTSSQRGLLPLDSSITDVLVVASCSHLCC